VLEKRILITLLTRKASGGLQFPSLPPSFFLSIAYDVILILQFSVRNPFKKQYKKVKNLGCIIICLATIFSGKGHCCTINLLCSTQCLGAPRVFISDFDNDLVISCSFLQRWDVRSYGFDIKKFHHLRVEFSVRLCKCFLQCIFCQICCYAQWFSANCMPIDGHYNLYDDCIVFSSCFCIYFTLLILALFGAVAILVHDC